MRSLALALALSLAMVPAAHAGRAIKPLQCLDAKGQFVRCPASWSAPAAPVRAPAVDRSGYNSGGGHPSCSKGKPCGDACIAVNKACHK